MALVLAMSSFRILSPRHNPEDQADEKDKCNEDERRRPRLPVPVLKRCFRVIVNENGERGNRLIDRRRPEAISERREKQRRGLSSCPGDGEKNAGGDSFQRRWKNDPDRRLPARDSQSPRRPAH